MKNLVILCFLILSASVNAQTFSTEKLSVHIYAPAPISDIEALTNTAFGSIDLIKKEVKVNIQVNSLSFKRALMQQHFNEKHIESDKYPTASFKGKFPNDLNLNVDSTYHLNIDGRLNLHGVNVNMVIPCNVLIKNKQINIKSEFKLKSKDFKIKTPAMLGKTVGEEIAVTVNGILSQNSEKH
jgi:polyisoprenoid-binding protein YceI